jgi:hypothetical protein
VHLTDKLLHRNTEPEEKTKIRGFETVEVVALEETPEILYLQLPRR